MADEILKDVQDGIAEFFQDDKKDKYKDGAGGVGSKQYRYMNVEKASVLLAARDFHNDSIVKKNPKQCVETITKLLYLQNNTSEQLTAAEATDIFFGITKLFVSTDPALRRIVYVILKQVYKLCDPSDVIIVTSCLTKDMTSDSDVYRANALRVLVRIIDSSMLSAIERYVKQAIINKSSNVSSAALVGSLHLFQQSADHATIVKRWVGEVNEAMKSPNEMVQYHATQLFYQIKSNDRLAVSKFVQKHSGIVSSSSSTSAARIKYRVRSPLAMVCLIRYASKLLQEEVAEGRAAPDASITNANELCSVGYKYLESCLHHESEMVSFEAARAICTLPVQAPEVVLPAFSVLQLSLSSNKPSSRLATVKLLCGLASMYPQLIARFNEGLEALIGDSNRLIGTLAIMTLLKTGNENSLDRLLKSISNFLYHIAEEYKIMVVQSLKRLCITYPNKVRIVLGFMSKFLRESGGFAFKRTIVKSILSLMEQVPETTEIALLHLCEFIEDCEFVALSTEILQILGDYGPKTQSRARYVRFIYNRCILENSMVRAAAISALAKYGVFCPDMRRSILTLLKSCVDDEDDEVRDRVVLSVDILTNSVVETDPQDKETKEDHEIEGAGDASTEDSAIIALGTKLPLSFDNLAQRLKAYQATPGAMESKEALSLDVLPVVEETQAEVSPGSTDVGEILTGLPTESSGKAIPAALDPAAIIYKIPELASFGRVFKSCTPAALTEAESEYVVHCIKHIMDEHIILQFTVQNTIEDQRLENVSVAIDTNSEIFAIAGELPIDSIKYGTAASCFTVLEKQANLQSEPIILNCELKFSVINVDPESGEDEGEPFDEEYPLEDLEIFTADFVAKSSFGDFRTLWEKTGKENEVLQKFGLAQNTIENASNAIIDCMGMQTCDGTGTIKPGAKQHMIHLSGKFLGGVIVLARCQIASQENGSILKMAIRSERKDVSKLIAECIC